MPLIAETLKRDNIFRGILGKPANPTYENQATNIQISKNKEAGIILEYTGMLSILPATVPDSSTVLICSFTSRYERINQR